MESVVESNKNTKRRTVAKIQNLAEGDFNKKTIALFGVNFKPDTDDMSEAPSLTTVPALPELGAKIRLVDPEGKKQGESLLPGVDWVGDLYKAENGADMIVVLT
jgi:UDPglucose 6-dehydrogenase